MKKLLDYFTGDKERCGFILKNSEIVEVQNICDTPTEGFIVRAEDIIEHQDNVTGFWHTHPGATFNLSVDDHLAFLNYPDWDHYIIGENGIRRYTVENGAIIQHGDEKNSSPREVQRVMPPN